MTTVDPDKNKKNVLEVVKRFQHERDLGPDMIYDLIVEFYDDKLGRGDCRGQILTMICDQELILTNTRKIQTPDYAQKDAMAVRMDPMKMDFPTFVKWGTGQLIMDIGSGDRVHSSLHQILSLALQNEVFGVNKPRKS